MMFRVALMACALLAAAPAQAGKFLITYSGTVVGSDNGGIFGAPGALFGDFTAVYTLTTGLPSTYVYADESLSYSYGYSQSESYHNPSPLKATLTINGVKKSFQERYGFVQQRNVTNLPGAFSTFDEVVHYIDVSSENRDEMYLGFVSVDDDIVDSSDFTKPFSFDAGPMTEFYGHFQYSEGGRTALGTLTPRRVTLEAAAPAIPEPATWAMMILGFAAVGAAMRRQRHQQAKVTFAF
jgi:hypothetical protein